MAPLVVRGLGLAPPRRLEVDQHHAGGVTAALGHVVEQHPDARRVVDVDGRPRRGQGRRRGLGADHGPTAPQQQADHGVVGDGVDDQEPVEVLGRPLAQ